MTQGPEGSAVESVEKVLDRVNRVVRAASKWGLARLARFATPTERTRAARKATAEALVSELEELILTIQGVEHDDQEASRQNPPQA